MKSEQLDEDLREIHIDPKDGQLCKHLEDVILAPLVARGVVQKRRQQDYYRGEQKQGEYEVFLPPPHPLLERILILALGLDPDPHLLRLDHEIVQHEPFHAGEQGGNHVRDLSEQFLLPIVFL